MLSSASCGALATTKRSFCLGSTARYPSSSSSIENFESGPLSPRSLRASCNAACHCLASTQYFSSELFSPTRETSTNHRIKIQSEVTCGPVPAASWNVLPTQRLRGPQVERLGSAPASDNDRKKPAMLNGCALLSEALEKLPKAPSFTKMAACSGRLRGTCPNSRCDCRDAPGRRTRAHGLEARRSTSAET